MTESGELWVRAPGKINLGLAVGTLAADGYHPLHSVFQAVGLIEDVRVRPAETFTVVFSGPIDTAQIVGDTLVHRAARLLAEAAGLEPVPGADIAVIKRVPIAGGMAGGSADAAATLVALNELWGLGLSNETLHGLAAQIGADVPFALHGGTQLGTGHGDQLSDVLTGGHYTWLLVASEHGLSTPAVYAELDRMRARGEAAEVDLETDERTPELLAALRGGDPRQLAPALFNDLDQAACSLQPSLNETRQAGVDAGALAAFVSGSGPTMVFLALDNQHALDIQLALRADGTSAEIVHGPVRGAFG